MYMYKGRNLQISFTEFEVVVVLPGPGVDIPCLKTQGQTRLGNWLLVLLCNHLSVYIRSVTLSVVSFGLGLLAENVFPHHKICCGKKIMINYYITCSMLA